MTNYKKFLEIVFIGENGKFSMTSLIAIVAFFITIYLFIIGLVLGTEVSAHWLEWNIDILFAAVGVRGFQRFGGSIGNGIASIGNKKGNDKSSDLKPNKIGHDTSTPHIDEHAQIGYFRVSDFNSRDGETMPKEAKINIIRLIDNLNIIRNEIGAPIYITSGYRSDEHNKSVGGKKNSYHLIGQAADIKVSGRSPSEVHALIKRLMDSGMIELGGLKEYNNFVHYDIRGGYMTW